MLHFTLRKINKDVWFLINIIKFQFPFLWSLILSMSLLRNKWKKFFTDAFPRFLDFKCVTLNNFCWLSSWNEFETELAKKVDKVDF